jgi:hypothetical protein
VTNSFQLNYEARLKNWHDLRKSLENSDVKASCLLIDDWWQKAPLVNHYLHPNDLLNWPGPWELLVDNNYCTIARGLGMCYTLLLMNITNVEFVLANNDIGEDLALVTVDHAKYILNYYPNTVISNNLQDFKVTNKLDIAEIIKKIK